MNALYAQPNTRAELTRLRDAWQSAQRIATVYASNVDFNPEHYEQLREAASVACDAWQDLVIAVRRTA